MCCIEPMLECENEFVPEQCYVLNDKVIQNVSITLNVSCYLRNTRFNQTYCAFGSIVFVL